MDDRVAREVEGEEPRLPAPVARKVERPQAILPVDADGERRIEGRAILGRLLEARVGVGDRLAAHQLGNLDGRRAARMEREEDASLWRDGDVPRRVVEVDHQLEGGGGQGRRRRPILEPHVAAAGDEEGEENCTKRCHGSAPYYASRSASRTARRAARSAGRRLAGTLTSREARAAAGMAQAAKWKSISHPS